MNQSSTGKEMQIAIKYENMLNLIHCKVAKNTN